MRASTSGVRSTNPIVRKNVAVSPRAQARKDGLEVVDEAVVEGQGDTRALRRERDAYAVERDKAAMGLEPVEMLLELRRRRRRVGRRRVDRVVTEDDCPTSRIDVRKRDPSGRLREAPGDAHAIVPRRDCLDPDPRSDAGSHISNLVPRTNVSTASAAARFDRQK